MTFVHFPIWLGIPTLRLLLVDCQTNQTLRPYNILIDQGSLIKY